MIDSIPTDSPPAITPQNKKTTLAFLKTRYFVISFVFLIFISITGLFLIRSKNLVSKSSKNNTELNSYNKVIQDQEERSKTRKPSIQPEFTREAKGNHVLHIVYIKPSNLNEATISSLINALSFPGDNIRNKCIGSKCYQAASLNYIREYLDQEKKRYDIHDFNITIEIHPLLSMDNLYKVGDLAVLWDKDIFGVAKLKDEFDKILIQNNIVIKEGDLIAFLYFDDSFDHAIESTERYYEHKKFRSFADYRYGKAYLNIYNLEEKFSTTTVEILTHELLHLFGANDKYEEFDLSRKCGLKGLGDPDLIPLFPQTQGDIMCMYIETSSNNFQRGYLAKNELNINKYTAKEIGWIK